MGIIKKITESELLGGVGNKDIYPVTHSKAVFTDENKNIEDHISKSIADEKTRAQNEELRLGLGLSNEHIRITDVIKNIGSVLVTNSTDIRIIDKPVFNHIGIGDISAQAYYFFASVDEPIEGGDIKFRLVKGDNIIIELGAINAGEYEFENSFDIEENLNDVELIIESPTATGMTFANVYYSLMQEKTVIDVINDERDRAAFAEETLNNKIQNESNAIATLNVTIINYNHRYGINRPVTKQEVIKSLLDKYTADKGTIVTYYAEDGWHTIQYKLNYYNPTEGIKESNWTEIVNEDAIKSIKDGIDNAYVKPEGGIPNTDLSEEVQETIESGIIANNLITNFNNIKPKIGAVNNDGTIYYGTSFCSHIALTGDGELLLNDGYFISKVVLLDKEGVAIDVYGENLKDINLYFGEPSLSWLVGFRKSDNTAFNDNDLEKVIKNVSFNSVAWNEYSNLDNYNCTGEYIIRGERKRNTDNMPINNLGNIEARLNVIADTIGKNATQVLTLLNVGGGDGNIYTRTRQDNTWGQWGKLQTNVEVGVINQQQMDALIDNGIYSGVLSTTGETFVLVVINNYAIATQAGYGGYISHLKYSVGLDGVVKVETRRRDAYGTWTDWQGIGGGGSSYTLPVATTNVLGGVKSYSMYGRFGTNVYGEVCALNVSGDGIASVTIPRTDDYDGQYGLVKVDASINSESKNPVSGKAVAKYVADAIDTSVVNQTTTTATIAPNVLNIWGEVAQLDITLANGKVDVVNEYMFQFTSGATATTLILPSDIKWVSAPNIQANKTYQVSIINNLGVIGEFSHE